MSVHRRLSRPSASAARQSIGGLRRASKPGLGLRALASRPATGRPRRLSRAQERQVFRWINGRDPRQYGLDFGLWTRSIVAHLIEQKFGLCLGVTAVGTLLAELGLTPQKPLQRAYQRDPHAIERWQREVFPEIARLAKASGGDVYFWDESGFRADTVHGRTWGVAGRRRLSSGPARDNPSARPRRSMRVAAFGIAPITAD